MEDCGLCGRRPVGYGAVQEGNDYIVLCHDAERDCYHRWTVYGERPGRPRAEAPVGVERRPPPALLGEHAVVEIDEPLAKTGKRKVKP